MDHHRFFFRGRFAEFAGGWVGCFQFGDTVADRLKRSAPALKLLIAVLVQQVGVHRGAQQSDYARFPVPVEVIPVTVESVGSVAGRLKDKLVAEVTGYTEALTLRARCSPCQHLPLLNRSPEVANSPATVSCRDCRRIPSHVTL